MTEKEYITQLENRCHNMAQRIITRLCKRAMREMNLLEATMAGSTDDYPKDFKFIDILSIELQDRTEEEINPFLEDYIRTQIRSRFCELLNEHYELKKIQKFIDRR